MKLNDVQDFVASLQGLDPENIGSWPLPVKLFVYAIVFVVVIVAGYAFEVQPMQDSLSAGRAKQVSLLDDFEKKVFKAENLPVYQAQLKDMEDSFGALLRQLPADTEVPGLLEDIDHTGVGSGLEVRSIDLAGEVQQDFYAEQPINIKVQGDFHAFGAFVSGVSALPRIVTLHDFKIEPMATTHFKDEGAPVLSMTILAKTYRYKEPDAGAKPKGTAASGSTAK